MKYFFKDTDNLFFLRGKRCVYRQNGTTRILNNDEEEFSILKKIHLEGNISKEEFEANKKLIKSLISQKILLIAEELKSEMAKEEKTYEYFLSTKKNFCVKDFLDFQNEKVLIVGLGGTALEVINQLVALDFKNYVLVDFDRVSENNLNRQFLFTKDDVGKFKTNIVSKHIKKSVVNSSVKVYNKKISSSNDFSQILKEENNVDLVVCCADNPPIEIQKWLITALLNKKTAFLCSGVGIKKGMVGPMLVQKKFKKKYLSMLDKTLETLDCVKVCSASFGATNSLISALTAKECADFLIDHTAQSLNSIITVNFEKYEITKKEI